MSREILFKAKGQTTGKWFEGLLVYLDQDVCRIKDRYHEERICDSSTLCQYTGLTDKNGKKIWENDITKLVLPDGKIRYFKVSIKSVMRKVICHPDFDDITAKVEITGVVFEWNGYELFPCIDTYGVPDYKMMEVIGNFFDNPELLEN